MRPLTRPLALTLLSVRVVGHQPTAVVRDREVAADSRNGALGSGRIRRPNFFIDSRGALPIHLYKAGASLILRPALDRP